MDSDTVSGLDLLKKTYREAEDDAFGLFLGAGANLPTESITSPKYPTYTWDKLLEALHAECLPEGAPPFKNLLGTHGDNWLALASAVRGDLSEERFAKHLERTIYRKMKRKDDRARLPRKFLRQAPTLRAAISFASAVKEKTEKKWTFKRNPTIGTVLTTNYDFFFGAGWTLYEAFKEHWKVQTRSSNKGLPPESTRRTINYLHGYIPYRPGEPQGVVLTKESYEDAYSPEGFTTETLKKEASRRNLVFVGFSFKDDAICGILNTCKGRKAHFAFTDNDSESLERIEGLKIHPIVVEDYADISEHLREIYCCSVSHSELSRVGLKLSAQYWERLWLGKAMKE